MKKHSYLIDYQELKDIQMPAFGYELLREVLLPDILGQDYPQMLYWAGKSMARKYPVQSTEELISFFLAAGWGNLELVQDKKNEMEFELSGDMIQLRFKKSNDISFQLEAGFVAEQLQQMNNHITETYEQIKKRANKVVFTVKWDHKDAITSPEAVFGKRSER